MLPLLLALLFTPGDAALSPPVRAALASQANNPTTCLFLHCAYEITVCYLNPTCQATLTCFSTCKPEDSACQYECEMTVGLGNPEFEAVIACMAANSCFPEVAPDGLCLATADDTVQAVTDLEAVAGGWWVVLGLNCGQDDVWRGGFDWCPCQHANYKVFGDHWINNTTFTGGSNSTPTTEVLVTAPTATLPSPGLIQLDYDDAALLPQVEKWHIVSYPDENHMMVIWCGVNPAVEYNGGFVVSRFRTKDAIPPESAEEFRQVAARLGFDYDDMCESDNTACVGESLLF